MHPLVRLRSSTLGRRPHTITWVRRRADRSECCGRLCNQPLLHPTATGRLHPPPWSAVLCGRTPAAGERQGLRQTCVELSVTSAPCFCLRGSLVALSGCEAILDPDFAALESALVLSIVEASRKTSDDSAEFSFELRNPRSASAKACLGASRSVSYKVGSSRRPRYIRKPSRMHA